MSTRSITPRTSCSAPIGISVATTCMPNAALSWSSVRKKSARSRSSMFTKRRRAMSSSAARSHSRCVETSTPMTALITKTADSQTRSDPRASATKLGSPGVSTRLTLRSFHSNEASEAEIDICRAFSSSSWSETVVPSATDPSRLTAPAWYSKASCNEVLPLPRCPTRATLRIRSGALCISLALLCRRLPRSVTEERARRHEADAGARLVVREVRAQAQHGLRVQLRHAGLRHAEDLADLPEREVLVVVEGDHELLPLGQARDGVGHAVLELGRVDDVLGVLRVGVVQRVEQRDLVAARVGHRPQLVERGDRRVRDLHERRLEVLDRDRELGRHLLVRRRAVELVLELRVGLLDLTGAGADGARHPVERAELVDDRAADARDRVGLELDLPREVEALDRVDQADEAVGDEVGLLDVRGQPRGHAAGDVLDER